MTHFKNTLVEGDPLDPERDDLIVQQCTLPIGMSPAGNGWRAMTGNHEFSLWARVAYRYEIEED